MTQVLKPVHYLKRVLQCNIVTNTGQLDGSQVWYTIYQVELLADLQTYVCISALLTTLQIYIWVLVVLLTWQYTQSLF